MKADFRNFPLVDIEGRTAPRDLSRELGNYIFNETTDIGEHDLARRIYHADGPVDLTEAEVDAVRRYLKAGFKAFVQASFEAAVAEAQGTAQGTAPAQTPA